MPATLLCSRLPSPPSTICGRTGGRGKPCGWIEGLGRAYDSHAVKPRQSGSLGSRLTSTAHAPGVLPPSHLAGRQALPPPLHTLRQLGHDHRRRLILLPVVCPAPLASSIAFPQHDLVRASQLCGRAWQLGGSGGAAAWVGSQRSPPCSCSGISRSCPTCVDLRCCCCSQWALLVETGHRGE